MSNKFLYDNSEKYSEDGDLLDPYLPEPSFKAEEFTKSAQYIATYLNDLHSVWTPHAGQVPVGQALFWDGKRRVFVRCGRKWGKALALDEVVIGPNGFIKMSDVKVGDRIFTEKGDLTTITDVWDVVTDRDVYEVEFNNGQIIKACKDHRWLTTTKGARKAKRDGITPRGVAEVVTTEEIARTLMYGKEYNHHIQKTQPLQFEARELPIDPYLLGCWLGDGASHHAKICTPDEEIVEAFRKVYGVSKYTDIDYGITGGLLTQLKASNLIQNKHVPEEYLYSSIEQRLSLLQGLMDTDGTIDKRGFQVTFDNTNENLADAVFWLASSLGMKTSKTSRIPKLKGVEHKRCYRVWFRPDLEVFRLTKKKERIIRTGGKDNNFSIVRCENIGPIPARCITVDNPTNLFLTSKSCIPTHNTEMLSYALYRWAGTIPNGQFYYVAPFYNQAAEIIWHPGRLKNFLGPHAKKYIAHIYETDRRIVFKNGSFIKLVGSDNHQAGRGFNPDGAVYDEFKDHDYRFHEGFVDNLITKKAPLLIVGTPPDTFDHFFVRTEEDFKFDDRGAYFKMPQSTNPHIDKEEQEREKQSAIRKGEWAKWMREVNAEIVPGGANSIFPMFEVPRYDERGNFIGESRHVKDHDKLMLEVGQRYKDYDYYLMFDPGSAITMAALLVAIHIETKKIYILDEIYVKDRNKTSTRQVYPIAQEKMRNITTRRDWFKGYDHAAAWFQVEVLNEFGEALTPCIKDQGEQKKEDKLSVIKDFMLADLYVVSKNCKQHINEVSTYATNEEGKIPKKNDHTIDCIRYIFNAAGISTLPKTRRTYQGEDARENSIEDNGYEFEEDVPPDIYDVMREFGL